MENNRKWGFCERWGYIIACEIAWCLLGGTRNAGLSNRLHDLSAELRKKECNRD